MLSSIHPLGERAKHNRYLLTAASFQLGSVLGAALTGAVLGLLALAAGALLSEQARLVLFTAGASFGALAEVRGWGLPSWRRQVDEDWLRTYRGWVYGVGYGLQLGAGLVTIISSAAVHVMVLAAVSSGSWWAALAILTTFGAVRGASIFTAAGVRSPRALATLHRALHRRAGRVRALSGTGLGVVAAAGLVALAA